MNSLPKTLLVLLCLSLVAPVTTFAQEDTVPQSDKSEQSAETDEVPKLIYRLWGDMADNPTFASGDAERAALRQLIRGRIAFEDDAFKMVAEVDLFAGRLVGDTDPTVPEDAQSGTQASRDLLSSGRLIDPREFYAQWLTPAGQLRGGLQTSQWGLGILANGGSTQTEGLFNQHFGGDRVLRAVFATAPLRPLTNERMWKDVYLAVGGDFVWRDENADLLAGDQALQAMSAILYDTDDTKGGTYVVYRNQTDRDDDFLEVWAFDVYGDHTMTVANGFEIRTAVEAAFLTGTSNRTLTQNGEPVTVTGLGAATEMGVQYLPAKLGLEFRGGYASGDANTDDDTSYRFRFDPNYDVGLVLFDHYLPAVTRTSASAIHDPTRSGRAPKGIGGLVNDGGIENAFYLSPRLLYGTEDGFLAGFSFLWAKADQAVFDPYKSFENGGVPTGINGRMPASKDLGMEFDAAMQYRFEPVDELTLEMKGEYGIFFPGEAFEDASGAPQGTQSLARVRMSVLW